MRSLHTRSFYTRRRKIMSGSVIVACVLTAAACSSSGTSKSGGPSNNASALKGAPIKVMLIRDGEGTPVNIPQIMDGAKAALNAINNSGGITGRPLVVDECNSRLDPNAAADCARRAVSGGYVAIVGSLTSNDAAIVPIVAAGHVPMIGLIPTSAAAYSSPDVFPINAGTSARALAVTKQITAAGAKKVGFLYLNVAAASAFVPVLKAGVTTSGGAAGKAVGVPAGAADMSSYVASALSDGADGLVLFTTASDALHMVQAIHNSGKSNVKIAFAVSSSDQLVKSLGGDADGLLTASMNRQTSETTYPGVKQYGVEMKASGFDADSNEYAINAWASVHLFAQVAASVKTVRAADIQTALGTAKYDSGGLFPTLDFSKPVTSLLISKGAPRIFTSQVEYVKVEHGAFQPTSDFVDLAG